MGSQTPDVQTLRASRKVLVTGPIMKKSDIPNFKRFLNTEAGKSGAVDRVDAEILPETFLLPELKGEDKVAVIASVLFKGATGKSQHAFLFYKIFLKSLLKETMMCYK